MHKPKNYYIAMQLARDVEVELLALKGEDKEDTGSKDKGMGWRLGGNLTRPFKSYSTTGPSPTSEAQPRTYVNGSPLESNRSHEGLKAPASQANNFGGSSTVVMVQNSTMKLSEGDQRMKGLCFRCRNKFHPLHCCTVQQLRLVILGEQETINEQGEIVALKLEDDGMDELG